MPLLASLPILLILILMVGFRWGAPRAGAAGYLSALILAIAVFGAGPVALAYAHARALILSLDVLYIIWTAYLFYRVVDEAGAIQTIGQTLPHLTSDRGLQAILIGWVFASFLQGAGGFGVPVAVTAPLLVGLGFSPLAAVVIPSVGHGWAVTFGSLGTSFRALMSVTGLSAEQLAAFPALFLGLAGLLTGPMVALAADGWQGVRRLFFPTLVIGAFMGAAQYLLATSGLWDIAAFGGGLTGLIVSGLLVRIKRNADQGPRGKLAMRPLLLALSAYGVLIALTLALLLVPPISKFLGQVVIQVDFPATTTALGYVMPAGTNRPIQIFTHTGTILACTSLLAFLIYKRAGRYPNGVARRILTSTVRGVMASSLSIVEMVAMALVMQQSGMTEALARSLAGGVGTAYPLIAPWIGALGAFMTGSNTNSNVVFAALQMRTAELLAYRVPVILAGQTAGAALASVVAPAKVVVGASTAGMAGKEGEVMRAVIVYAGLLILFICLLTGAVIWL